MRTKLKSFIFVITAIMLTQATCSVASAATGAEASRQTILTALMGAGTGAISAEASGGKAGTGALVGAGTQLIGSVLLQLLAPTQSSARSTSWSNSPVYAQAVPDYPQPYTPPIPYMSQPTYSQVPAYNQPTTNPASYYQQTSNNPTDSGKEILKSGLMGAATGAIAAEASNGKAGTGALVGAGTQVIGSALLDVFFQPSTPNANQYYSQPIRQYDQQPMTKKIIRKYNSQGQVVSEEEFWV